ASHFAGRVILCPRCRQKTHIPSADSTPEPSPDEPRTPSNAPRESSNAFAKLCVDFAPNPFAFSVRLEEFAPPRYDDAEENRSTSDASSSKTPSVNELIATLLEENR
ncbi:MAG: hypothetical protein IJE97_06620, partial [Thermoguttaceae bacterium]|nr:hypothetical protein [Thermoguttaceae bacterium]